MFVEAIEKAKQFTRPIHTISRLFRSKEILPGAATLFFVNEEGYALTCKHVVNLLLQAEQINKRFSLIKSEKHASEAEIERKYKINGTQPLQLKNTFVDCVDKLQSFTTHVHPKYDLAIIKFNGFEKLMVNEFAVFKKDANEIKQGKFLCRLGYPFPEFNNFKYNEAQDDIQWTSQGNRQSPSFPIEGMVTRFQQDQQRLQYGIELSTPGLKGQSGGPLFDENGVVCGMQSRTKHLHLGFDLENKEIIAGGKKKKINDYSFIHLGECIHVDVIKDFLRQHHVSFNET
ncbi:serine protease [Jiulongibacter sediminis]|uniref:S1 family peptidase n=1 Tax=Jiulongibacter sediminis TaxID=1605367 RepID=UPI0026EE7E58|nr:serine protease [Jiulongibacter sediminis]